MFPAVGRELQMGVAMEASSSSHFLAEFISNWVAQARASSQL